MRLAILLLLCSTAVHAQSVVYDDLSPREAYSLGFKEGWEQGYDKARKDLHRDRERERPAYPAAPPPIVTYPITISLARYGIPGRECDATRHVARQANGRISASIEVSNSICGDPARGERKSLDITYICGNRAKTASAFEHRTAYLSCND